MESGKKGKCSGFFIAALLAGLWAMGGCGEGDDPFAADSSLLAVVRGEWISEEALRLFEASIQQVHRSEKEGSQAHREHLESLIDIKLMVLEAEDRGLHQDAKLSAGVEQVRQKAMVETYLRSALEKQIKVTEDELLETFESHPASQAVRAAHILLATDEEAQAVYAEIVAGRSFEELALERSLDRKTAERGGAFDRYFAFDRVSDKVYGQVFGREVGDVIEPFRTGQGFEVVKVLGKKQVDFEKYRPLIMQTTLMRKFALQRDQHVASLEDTFNLHLHQDRFEPFVEAWNRQPGKPDLSPEELAAPLYEFDGGHLTLEQAVNVLVNTRKGQSRLDRTAMDEHIRQQGVAELLLQAAAQKAGLADHPEVATKTREEREKRLLEKLWDVALEKVVATEEEARAHYQAHAEMYRAPKEIIVQEILLPTRQQADSLLTRIEEGADMGKLAAAHSIRMYAERNGGIYGIRPFERLVYNELLEAAMAAPEEALQGPVEISTPLLSTLKDKRERARAFSIFKVLERRDERLREFEDPAATRLSFFYARREKQRHKLDELNGELRRKYQGQFAINEAALERYAEAFAAN